MRYPENPDSHGVTTLRISDGREWGYSVIDGEEFVPFAGSCARSLLD